MRDNLMFKDSPTVRDSNGKTYCVKCGRMVSQKVEDFALRRFGKVLCMSCQYSNES